MVYLLKSIFQHLYAIVVVWSKHTKQALMIIKLGPHGSDF